ncbi:hypothetical protein B0H14DRAFT_124010 [Mycena olivaceomarginata]|nr:hypothetical protein B0H14DRAFT_124010 [Mycena olivaceomarginata]
MDVNSGLPWTRSSTDLWVVSSPDFVYNTHESVPLTMYYAGGPVNGTTGYAHMTLGNYTFAPQAFMNATSVGLVDITDVGLDGLLGLAFTTTDTRISQRLWDPCKASPSTLTSSTNSRPWTTSSASPFHVQKTPHRTLAMRRSRSNEVDPLYSHIVDTAPIPLFLGDNGRWSVVVGESSSSGEGVIDLAASNDSANANASVEHYGPIIVGLLGGNLVVLLVLAALGAVLCARRGGKFIARTGGTYAPVKLKEEDPD